MMLNTLCRLPARPSSCCSVDCSDERQSLLLTLSFVPVVMPTMTLTSSSHTVTQSLCYHCSAVVLVTHRARVTENTVHSVDVYKCTSGGSETNRSQLESLDSTVDISHNSYKVQQGTTSQLYTRTDASKSEA